MKVNRAPAPRARRLSVTGKRPASRVPIRDIRASDPSERHRSAARRHRGPHLGPPARAAWWRRARWRLPPGGRWQSRGRGDGFHDGSGPSPDPGAGQNADSSIPNSLLTLEVGTTTLAPTRTCGSWSWPVRRASRTEESPVPSTWATCVRLRVGATKSSARSAGSAPSAGSLTILQASESLRYRQSGGGVRKNGGPIYWAMTGVEAGGGRLSSFAVTPNLSRRALSCPFRAARRSSATIRISSVSGLFSVTVGILFWKHLPLADETF